MSPLTLGSSHFVEVAFLRSELRMATRGRVGANVEYIELKNVGDDDSNSVDGEPTTPLHPGVALETHQPDSADGDDGDHVALVDNPHRVVSVSALSDSASR
jgi:hypothetical protein